MSNPWKKVSAPTEVLSLSDIMSEEYAKSIRLKDEQNSVEHRVSIHTSPEDLKQARSTSDCDDATAKMAQCDLDEEHEDVIKRAQDKLDRDAKLAVAYDCNMHQLSTTSTDDSDSEESVEETISNDWEYFETDEEFTCLPKQTHVPKDNRLAIKHDIINSRRIVSSLLDESTRQILWKLINDKEIESINSVIHMGKESIILHAYGVQSYCQSFPHECAIKVFKTTRKKSISSNRHIKDNCAIKTPLELAHDRVEKQVQHSHKLYFLRNPLVCYQNKNMLAMQFIGEHGKPAPNLIDVTLTPEEWQSAYTQVADAVKKLYQIRHLIHGRLIEDNVKWWNNECWFIFSQSVHQDHPKGYKVLLRDCHNIFNFFKKKGVKDMKKSKEELFEWIVGIEVAHFIKN